MAASVPFHQDPDFMRPQQLLLVAAFAVLLWAIVGNLNLVVDDPKDSLRFALRVNEMVLQWPDSDAKAPNLPFPGNLGTVLFGFGLAFPLLALLQYRKRSLSLRFIRLGLIYLLLVQGLLFGAKALIESSLSGAGQRVEGAMELGFFVPTLAFVLLLGALLALRADLRRLRRSERFW